MMSFDLILSKIIESNQSTCSIRTMANSGSHRRVLGNTFLVGKVMKSLSIKPEIRCDCATRRMTSYLIADETPAHTVSPSSSEDPSSAQASHQDQNVVFLMLPNFFESLHRNMNAADLPPPTRYARRPRAQRSERIHPSHSSFEDISG